MTTELLLPDDDEAGQVRRWYLPINDRDADDVEYYRTYARFLGVGTSHTAAHSSAVHSDGFVPKGTRCNACRWFEARIFRELTLPDGVETLADLEDPGDAQLGRYVMHYAGMSIAPGEVPLYRYETTASPYMVIESMTTRRLTDRGPEVFLAKPSAHALAAAAAYDTGLRDAYENRAVS